MMLREMQSGKLTKPDAIDDLVRQPFQSEALFHDTEGSADGKTYYVKKLGATKASFGLTNFTSVRRASSNVPAHEIKSNMNSEADRILANVGFTKIGAKSIENQSLGTHRPLNSLP
jgi:hypothetical protein